MYLVTILPGPWESMQEQFNNLIDPLIDDFRDIWEHGIQYLALPTHLPLPVWMQCCCNCCFRSFGFSHKLLEPSLTKIEEDDDMCHLSSGVYLLRNGIIECLSGNESTTLTEMAPPVWAQHGQWSPLLKCLLGPWQFLLLIPMHNLSWDLLHLMFESFLLMFGNQWQDHPNFWKGNSCGKYYGGQS